jgi:plastocyanin
MAAFRFMSTLPILGPSSFPRIAAGLLALLATSARAQVVNNCLPGDYVDRRGTSPVTIGAVTQPGIFRYTPRCIVIDAGTTVNFTLNFAMHPTIGGRVSGGVGTADPDSPIGAITNGESTAVVFDVPGLYGFYCDFHVPQAMMGAIEVPFVDGFE